MSLSTLMRPTSRLRETRQSGGTVHRRGDAKPRLIVGYASVFGVRSTSSVLEKGKRFHEVIEPGAFARVLRCRVDVRATVDHDNFRTLGHFSEGALKLWEDSRGLAFEIDPPDTAFGHGTVERVDRRGLVGASFRFTPAEVEWRDGVRHVWSVRTLDDVSLTNSPIYRQTAVGSVPRGASRDSITRTLRLILAEASL